MDIFTWIFLAVPVLILIIVGRISDAYASKERAKKHEYEKIKLEEEAQRKNYEELSKNLQAEYKKKELSLKTEYEQKEAKLEPLKKELTQKLEKWDRLSLQNLQSLSAEYKKKELSLNAKYEQKEHSLQKEYAALQEEFKLERQKFHIQESYVKKKETYLNEAIKGLDRLIEKQCTSYPALAAVMADILSAHYIQSAKLLEKKKRPAIEEAKRIRELHAETKAIIEEKKKIEYDLAYIRTIFPNIDDIFDSGFTAENFELETEVDTDRTRLFLSHEEYASLSTTERNQLALDRYITSRKSKWEVGRDFELYIGYLCESQGWTVQYSGILEKLEDLGRDLIIRKDCTTIIIQCKNWAQTKTIHEKHIFQLYGTLVLYKLEHPMENVKGAFISTTRLSEIAENVAKHLEISIIYKEMDEFPRIKCNINGGTGEKIYHLPFDQQYERAIISKERGEFYATTVAEAEKQGFRRAFKHNSIQ